jgi:hypothetical protein
VIKQITSNWMCGSDRRVQYPNTALVHSLGFAHVIDHTKKHHTRGPKRYDPLLNHREPRHAGEQARAAGDGGVRALPRPVDSPVRRVVLLSSSIVALLHA